MTRFFSSSETHNKNTRGVCTCSKSGHPRNAAEELPYEIWLAILRFLSDWGRWRVRALNRVTYEVVMDQMFSHMKIVSLGGSETERNIKFLRSPTIVERVHHLTIHNQLLLVPPPHEKERGRVQRPVAGTYSQWIDKINKGFDGDAELVRYPPKTLFNSITKLDTLRSLQVLSAREDWNPRSQQWGEYTAGLAYLHSVLRASCTTLVRLSLYLPLAAFSILLEPGLALMSESGLAVGDNCGSALTFPNLEDLSFEFCKSFFLDSMEAIAESLLEKTIPDFVFRHTELKVLAIRVHPSKNHAAMCIPLSPLFRALSSRSTTLRRLQSFSITNPVISFGMTDYDDAVSKELEALADFLRKYTGQLTALQLDLQAHYRNIFSADRYSSSKTYNFLPPPSKWFSNELFKCSFTHLKTLDLSLLFYSSRNTTDVVSRALARYLGPLAARGLRVLKIRDYDFSSLSEIRALLGPFVVEGHNGLTELDIMTRYLSPSLLDLLAERLPALEVLGLTFETFVPKEGIPADELPRRGGYFAYIPRFSELLQNRSYAAHWPNLRLSRLTSYGYVDGIAAYRSALVEALPDGVRYQIGDVEMSAREWVAAVGMQAEDFW